MNIPITGFGFSGILGMAGNKDHSLIPFLYSEGDTPFCRIVFRLAAHSPGLKKDVIDLIFFS